MTQQTYSYTGELRSVRCCDCGAYVGSHYPSAITSYKKQCLKTGRFVWAMQNPCDDFSPKYPDNIIQDSKLNLHQEKET